jgi:hypothetical protein
VNFSTGVMVDTHCQVLLNKDCESLLRVFSSGRAPVAHPITAMQKHKTTYLILKFLSGKWFSVCRPHFGRTGNGSFAHFMFSDNELVYVRL